jgi:hypothetical protein
MRDSTLALECHSCGKKYTRESDLTKHLPRCKPMKKNVKSAEKGISRPAGRLSVALENRSRSALSRFGPKKLSEDSVNSGRSGDGPKKRRGVLEDDSMNTVSTSCSDYVLVHVHEHCRVASGPPALPSLPFLLLIHSQCLNTKNLHHFIHCTHSLLRPVTVWSTLRMLVKMLWN